MKIFGNDISEPTEITEIKEGQLLDWPGTLEATASREKPARGWILYDGDCRSCTASASAFERIFSRRGFQFLPLQTLWVQKRLGLEPNAPLEEMRVLTRHGRDFSGADAVIFLARQIWWSWPLYALARFPGIHCLLNRCYHWVAAHRGCNHIACNLKERRSPDRPFFESVPGKSPLLECVRWFPLLLLPALVLLTLKRLQPWIFMWLMTGTIFLGCKWLTFCSARNRFATLNFVRVLGYFFLWPGMDARKFLGPSFRGMAGRVPALPNERTASIWSILKIFFGAVLLFGVTHFAPGPVLAGWTGMIGMIFILHFGLFDLAAIGWRAAGVDVDPIMNAPLRARSLGEFWGRRWNAAFNRLAFDFVFRPLAHRIGAAQALVVAFLISGLIHELVISLPANSGYGLPTVYFLLQGGGILIERAFPKICGRVFTLVIAAGPAFWLFHPPFVRQVIIPFMHAIDAL